MKRPMRALTPLSTFPLKRLKVCPYPRKDREYLTGCPSGPGSAGSEGESDEGDLSDEGAMSMEEMMDKILEGRVNEVDDFLSTLDPDVAASTKKNLLERIDAIMQSEDFKD